GVLLFVALYVTFVFLRPGVLFFVLVDFFGGFFEINLFVFFGGMGVFVIGAVGPLGHGNNGGLLLGFEK
ncbi:hypothetical protein ACEN8K_47720, partial [Variovorax sp. CT11-76]